MAQAFFHTNSIHSRAINWATAKTRDVKDAIFWATSEAPVKFGLDFVELIYKDTNFAAVNVKKSVGFTGAQRRAVDMTYDPNGLNGAGIGLGAALASIQCHPYAGVQASKAWEMNGHGSYLDIAAGLAFDLYAKHREGVGQEILTAHPMYTWTWKNIATGAKAANGAGFYNDGRHGSRGSGLDSIVGCIQEGEIESGAIEHVLMLVAPQTRFSKDVGWIWPAVKDDDVNHPSNPNYAVGHYQGPNDAYTNGTLLALPSSVDINKIVTEYGPDAGRKLSPAGKIIAKAFNKYGAYIGDAAGTPGTGQWSIAIDPKAAIGTFGFGVDSGEPAAPYTKKRFFSHITLYSLDALQNDLLAILNHVVAVSNNWELHGLVADPGVNPVYVP